LVTAVSSVALLAVIALIYSGALPLLGVLSRHVLYAIYLTLFAGCFFAVLTDRRVPQNLRSVLPYLGWLILYFGWGTLFAPDQDAVLPVVRVSLVRNVLILSAVAIALVDIRALVLLAHMIQIVAILNAAVSLWETLDPRLISTIAFMLNPDARAFSELRPAGLWSNPNQAAFAFVFALLISHWSHGALAWAGRAASLLGVYLTVSRGGIYTLIVCGVAYLLFRLQQMRFTPGRVSAFANGLAVTAAAGWLFFGSPALSHVDLSDNWGLSRLLDYSERASGQATRAEITSVAARSALDGPWHGYGAFSFQGISNSPFRDFTGQGAHNIYLTVWGECGILFFITYLLLLGYGAFHLLRIRIASVNRLILGLMWISYMMIGFVWHNQFTSTAGMILIALLYHLPRIVEAASSAGTGRPDLGAR
jgi:hypothetical protein